MVFSFVIASNDTKNTIILAKKNQILKLKILDFKDQFSKLYFLVCNKKAGLTLLTN